VIYTKYIRRIAYLISYNRLLLLLLRVVIVLLARVALAFYSIFST